MTNKRIIGSGVTEFEVESETFDPTDRDRFGDVLRRATEFASNPIVGMFATVVEDCRELLERLGPGDFAEYKDEGWFAQEIDRRYRRALKARAEGNADKYARHAANLGWLVGLAQMKFSWVERAALIGQKVCEGGRSRLRQDERNAWFNDRNAEIRAFYAEALTQNLNPLEAKMATAEQFEVKEWTVRRALREDHEE